MHDKELRNEVLLAFYLEYEKDIPQIKRVSHESLGISEAAFNFSLVKLHEAGLISNIKATTVKTKNYPTVYYIDLRLTEKGEEFIEDRYDIKPSEPNSTKIKKIWDKAADFSIERFDNVLAKYLAEMTKNR